MESRRVSLFNRNSKAFSQGSKTTSTPQTNNTPNVSFSPSVSSISDHATPMEVDESFSEDSGTFTPAVNSTLEDTQYSFDESIIKDSRKVGRKLKTIKWEGFWSSLKPKNKESLYFKTMSQPSELESIVTDLLNLYHKNSKEAVTLILQFFVDLCGYKKLAVGKYYNFEGGNSNQIIQLMESELMDTELKKTGKFLFLRISKFENAVETILANFIKYLVIIASRTEILYDGVLLGHLLEFINCMSFSNIRAIRVTGVVLAVKCLTAFVNLYNQLLIYLEDNAVNQSQNSIMEKMDDKRTTIENCMDFLYMIYDKNCLIYDKKCYTIRAVCAQEVFEWMSLFPYIFIIKRRSSGRLMRLVQDSNEVVRLSALDTCQKLIESDSDQIHEELIKRIELFVKIISTRIIDVHYKIAVKALSFFTEAIDRYSKYISKHLQLLIFHKVYHTNFLLATAAGKFIVCYFRKHRENEEQLVLTLAKIAFLKKEFAERVPFFVEACIQFTNELKDWDFIIGLILKDEIELNSKKHLLEILKESIRYSLIGKCSQSRRTLLGGSPQNTEEHIAVANALIPRFGDLILLFQNDKKCVNQLIEILTFIDHEQCLSSNLNNHYAIIINLLKELFQVTTDKLLIENICVVFFHFAKHQAYNVILERIKVKYVTTFIEDLKQLSPECDKDLLVRLREKSLKTSFLFAKFNLTDLLKWEDIFEVWDNNYLKALKYLIVCCKWYLVWGLRHLIEHTENNGTNHFLYNNCKEFIYSCLQMLKNADNSSESFLIFESICDFYNIFGKELKRKRQFENFIIKISEPEAQEVLFKFLIRHVIESSTLPLIRRQKYLNSVVDIIFLEALPIECLSKILRFYHSRYTEFGTIFNNVLSQLHLAIPALSLLIIHTLIEIYERIVETRKVVNISNDESKELKLLAKKFATTKILKSSSDALKLVNMAICFSFSNERNYVFLYFSRYFVDILNEDAKSEAYDLFKQLVPDKEKNNDIILFFANSLKPRT